MFTARKLKMKIRNVRSHHQKCSWEEGFAPASLGSGGKPLFLTAISPT